MAGVISCLSFCLNTSEKQDEQSGKMSGGGLLKILLSMNRGMGLALCLAGLGNNFGMCDGFVSSGLGELGWW